MASEEGGLLYSVLKVRRGEATRTFLHFFYLLNAVGAFIVGRNVASALFLAEYDAARLPWMYVGSAAVVSASSWAWSRVIGRARLDRLIVGTTLILVVLLLGARVALHLQVPFAYPALYVLVEMMGSLLVIQFWSFANAVHNTREAKRLFGFIGAGGVLANVVLGFGAAALVGRIGTENLILVMAGNLLVAAILAGILGRRSAPLLAHDAARVRPGRARIAISQETARVFSSRHLRLIAGVVVLTFVVTTLVDYQFKILARQTYDKEALTTFFSLLYGFTGLLAFALQLLVTGRLLERFGILAALALLPAFLVGGSAVILVVPLAATAALAKGADAVLRYTVNDVAAQLLYLPVPGQVRLKAKAFIDGILKPVAYGSTGLALAASVALWPALNDRVHLLAIPAGILGLAWLFLVLGVRREYVRSLLTTLRHRRLDLTGARIRITDDATRRALAQTLAGKQTADVVHALELLPSLDGHDWSPLVALLLGHESAQVRLLALRYLAQAGSLRFGPAVHQRLTDPDEEVRAAAVEAYCAIGREKAVRAVQPLLEDGSPAIRGAAVVGMVRNGGLDGLVSAAATLQGLLEATEPRLREHGARALGEIGVRSFYRSLLPLFADPDPRVRLAAVVAAGLMRSPELVPSLVYKLADPATAGAAVRALSSHPGIERTLSKVLGNAAERPAIRELATRALARVGTEGSAEILASALGEPDEGLRHRICHGLNRLHQRNPALRPAADRVGRALEGEIAFAWRTLRILGDLGLDPATPDTGGLLARALQEKLDRNVDRVFLLLGVLQPGRSMAMVQNGLSSESAVVRANALEVLENLLPRPLRDRLMPLLDERSRAEKLAFAEEALGQEPLGREAACDLLLVDPSPWVVACALQHLAAAGLHGRAEVAFRVRAFVEAPSPVVRETAAAVVAHALTPDEAREVLRPLALDPSPQVRRVAAHYLRNLGPLPGAEPATAS